MGTANKGNITKRIEKGSALTHVELDQNFVEIEHTIDDIENVDIKVNKRVDDFSKEYDENIDSKLQPYVDNAGQEADRAEIARDAAQLSAGIYADTAAGLAATTEGDYFSVADGNDAIIMYRNESGAAVEKSRILGSAGQRGAANILFDPFMRVLVQDEALGGFSHFAGGSFASSANSPFPFQVRQSTDGGLVDRKYDLAVFPIQGDTVTVRILAWFAQADGRIYAYWRDSGNNVLATETFVVASAGLTDEHRTIAVPASATRLDFRVWNQVNGGVCELIATAMSEGPQKPAFSEAPAPASYLDPYAGEAAQTAAATADATANQALGLANWRPVANLCPDPAHRLYADGVTEVDGQTLVGQPLATEFTDNNPFASPALVASAGYNQVDRYIALERLNLRVDQVLSIKLGVWATEKVSVSGYMRDASNNVIGPTGSVGYTPDPGGEYFELHTTRTITQAMLDDGAYFQLRALGPSGGFTADAFLCMWAIYEGAEDVPLIKVGDAQYALDTVNPRVKALEAVPTQPVESPWLLRETRMRLRQLALGDNASFVVAMIGDSWTHNAYRYSRNVAITLQGDYGSSGIGWVSFGHHNTVPSLVNGNIIGGGNWDWGVDDGNWTFHYGGRSSPDGASIESATAGDYFSATLPTDFDQARLYWVGTADGVVRYQWDGGTWYTLNVQGSGLNFTDLTLDFTPDGFANFRIEVVSGTVELAGMNCWVAGASGVRAAKLGLSGGTIGSFLASSVSNWQASLADLAPDLVTIMFGTNDQRQFTADEFDTNLRTLIGRARTARPTADIAIVMPAENQRTDNPVTMGAYADKARLTARELRCAFLDLQAHFGDDPDDYAYDSDRPWFASDLIHPEPATGGRVITDAVYRLLTDNG